RAGRPERSTPSPAPGRLELEADQLLVVADVESAVGQSGGDQRPAADLRMGDLLRPLLVHLQQKQIAEVVEEEELAVAGADEAGVGEVPAGWKTIGCSQRSVPSSGSRPTSRSGVMRTTSGTAPGGRAPPANRTGDDVLAASSRACHCTAPVSACRATTQRPLP